MKSLAITCGLLMIAVYVLSTHCVRLNAENKRMDANQTALLEKAEYYRTEAGKSAASVDALTLSKSEIERHCEDLTNTVKELDLKVKRLQAASSTATETKVVVRTVVKDSIVYVNMKPDTIKAFVWSDPWIDIAGNLRGNDIDIAVHSSDTLRQVVHRVPKKFLFFRWGTKAIRQEVVSSNPHTTVVYTEYIELKK